MEEKSNEQPPGKIFDGMCIQMLESSVFGDCNEKDKDLLSRHFRDIVGSIIVLFDPLSCGDLKSAFPALSVTIDVSYSLSNSFWMFRTIEIYQSDSLAHGSVIFSSTNNAVRMDTSGYIREKLINVAEQCLHFMSKTLERNICRLESPGTSKREISKTVLN